MKTSVLAAVLLQAQVLADPVALDIHRAVWNTLYVASIMGCMQLTADNWPGTSPPGTCRPSLPVHNLVSEVNIYNGDTM